jgi:hypothetical protein
MAERVVRSGSRAYEEVEGMSFIKVSSSRGDYALVNLEQVAWATVETNEAGGASRITLHMVDYLSKTYSTSANEFAGKT